jgi:hypothetical protein
MTKEDGLFGILFEGDGTGFSAEEYGSIPPVASEDLIEDLDPALEEALERLLINPGDLKYLGEDIIDTILIIQYGYVSMLDSKDNCRAEALSHRSSRVQYLWSRLDWDEIIVENFPPKSPKEQEQWRELYKEIDKELPTSRLYRTPSVQWNYMAVDYQGYAGARWYIRSYFLEA